MRVVIDPLPEHTPDLAAESLRLHVVARSGLRENASTTAQYFCFSTLIMQTMIASRGQITIPRNVRHHFGLQQRMAIAFAVEGDHTEIRPASSARQGAAGGFGLIRSRHLAVPVDFDVASVGADAP